MTTNDDLLTCQITDDCITVIVENTPEARDKFGHMWGSGDIQLSRADIQALLDGKCVAFHDGEYTTFLTLKAEGENA